MNRSEAVDIVYDLRAALNRLRAMPGQFLETTAEVDPVAELAGVYKLIGAGHPVAPPTRIGPAMMFRNVKGFSVPVVCGVMASRVRSAALVGSTTERLGFAMMRALRNPIDAVTLERQAIVEAQEVVHRPPFDIRTLLPAPTNTELDAGPYFNMGVAYAEDPDTGEGDVTIHRLCLQGPDRLSIYFAPGRHIDVFRQKAESRGKPLPISISMGLSPAVYLATSFMAPATPLGMQELSIAGGLLGRAVELAKCVSQPTKAIANAEIVLEGEILPNDRIREDVNSGTGYAMPEFPGYMGHAQPSLPVIRLTAVTTRRDPILQTIVGTGEEQVNLNGIPAEAAILSACEAAMPGRVVNAYAASAGGGKYLAIIQFKKSSAGDEGRQRQAALSAFASCPELKHVILVDDDVDLFDPVDVMWAMTTRYQGDVSHIVIPGVKCHPLDPSQQPGFSPLISVVGTTSKTIFDCTVPFAMKDKFLRASFREVDISRFCKN